MSIKIIKANELHYYMTKQNVILVDIRTKQEYDIGHISGAVHVPIECLETFMRTRGERHLVILYCERGITSVKEANRLSKIGFSMGTLAGGFRAYNKSR